MARIKIIGHEGGTSDITKYSSYSGATVISSTGLDMDSNYCLDCNAATEYAGVAFTADDEMYTAFLYRPTTLDNVCPISFWSGGTLIFSLRIFADGSINANAGGVLASSFTGLMTANATRFMEVYYKLADSGGRISVKINGVVVQGLDFTGDTKPSTDATFDAIRFGSAGVSTLTQGFAYFDNIILDTTAWIGKTYIQGLAVTGAGATTQLTPSAGNNYACVDEIPASATDYVYSNTNNHIDTYVAGDLTGTIGTIKSVSVNACAIKEGAATPTNLQLVTRPGSTDRVSADVAIPTSYAVLQAIWELNPDTSAAWVEAEVNATEIGIKVVA